MKDNEMKALFAAMVVSVALGLMGCNTVKGVGQDLQKAGESIEGAVKKK
jgi:predicted small secreted protein